MNQIIFNKESISPSKVVCIGRNYVAHIEELNNEVPDEPVVFIKPNSAIGSRLFAKTSHDIHYEGEICFLIQQQKLAGIGIGLDLTKRDVQTQLKTKGLPWERAKAFDNSALFSEFLPIAGEIGHYQLTLAINNQITQEASYELMMVKPQALLEEIQSFMTLEDGDILMTGTPKGVGKVNKGDEFTLTLLNNSEVVLTHTWVAS